MVDGLFCATLTGRRGGHTPFVQAGAETSDTGTGVVEPDPGSSWEGRKRFILQFPAETPSSPRPIHIDQGSPNFLGEDHVGHCTTVRGPDISPNVTFSGNVIFYLISKVFVNILFFHYWQNVFCGWVKWLRR